MAKDPAFLFYYEKFIGGTKFRGHTPEMKKILKGCYIDLLCEQADIGFLTLEAIKEICNGLFEKVWPVLKEKFTEKNGVFFNKKLREVITKRKEYSESRRHNRLNKKKKQEKDMNNINITQEKHPINININKNINTNKDIKERYKPVSDCPFFNDPDFKDAWLSWQIVRNKKKCSNSDRAIKIMVNKLMSLSGGNKEIAIKILDQSSVGAGWSDLYPLKDSGRSIAERLKDD